MLAERYAACAGAPARARGSCRAGGRAGLSSAFGRVPRCAARFETTASGHAVRSVSTSASGPVVDAAFGVEGRGYLEVDGGARLEGVARVGGAKNAVLALLAGALACREPVTIRGVPLLKDVMSMIDVLRSVGARVHIGVDGPDTVTVDARALDSHSPDPAAVEKLRASFFAAGPSARLGRVEMPLPGGCAIGARPVDLHLHGFEALGAEVHVTPEGTVIAVATGPGGRLRGAGVVTLRFPSVGATHAVVAAAALAEGDTIIEGAAAEPEVADLAAMLNAAGAKITGVGTPTVRIRGVGGGGGRGGEGGGRGDVSGLRGCVHDAIPDRVEAGTFLVAAACTGSALELYPVVSAHLTATIDVRAPPRMRRGHRIRTGPEGHAGAGVRDGSTSFARRAAPRATRAHPTRRRRARTIRRGLHHATVPRGAHGHAAPAVRAGGDGEGDVDDSRDCLREPVFARRRAREDGMRRAEGRGRTRGGDSRDGGGIASRGGRSRV